MPMRRFVLVLCLACALPVQAAAQAQVRLETATRGTYSELHEGLRAGTPAAAIVARLLAETQPLVLWRTVRAALADQAPWNDAVLALTRLAELPRTAVTDSARQLALRIDEGKVEAPPGRDAADLLDPLRAVLLAAERTKQGDAAIRANILGRVPAGDYGLPEAWTLARLGGGVADTLAARFLAAKGEEQKVRWLTLLSFAPDTAQIALLGRVFAAPDSFGVSPRFAGRASDGLMWIGTWRAFETLAKARATAKARGVYDAPALARGGYSFLDNDSSLVISRTGRWITEWLDRLK